MHIFVCCHFIVTIFIIILLLYSFIFIFVHTCDLFLRHSEIQPKLVKHGAFPLVSVQVWHGEPGNFHPYNFKAQTYYYSFPLPKLILFFLILQRILNSPSPLKLQHIAVLMMVRIMMK